MLDERSVDIEEITKRSAALPERFNPLLLTFRATPSVEEGGVILGTDYGTRLILDAETGAIESVDPEGTLPVRFVNSSVGQLVRCIEAYAAYLEQVQTAPDDSAVNRAAERLRVELARIDPTCTADPESWWSVVLEQVDDGVL